MFSREATNSNFSVTWLGLEPMIYWGEHTNHYITDAVNFIWSAGKKLYYQNWICISLSIAEQQNILEDKIKERDGKS
jgi:hypothetical protein